MTRAVNLASAGSIVSESVGDAPGYMARAWVNFNGTGTVAIREDGNVSSITDNGTGDYTVNFTTAMADANYSTQVTGSQTGATNGVTYGVLVTGGNPAMGAVRVLNGRAFAALDSDFVNVSIFR